MNITIISDGVFTKTGNKICTMANALSERGHKIDVILPYYEKYYTDSKLKLDIFSQFSVNCPQGSFNINLFNMTDKGVNYYFISNNKIFARENKWGYLDDAVRINVFCTAAIEFLINNDITTDCLITSSPNTGLVPVLLKFKYHTNLRLKSIKCYHYINGTDQGIYDKSVVSAVFGLSPEDKHILICKNRVNLTKAAIISATRVFIGENSVPLLYDHNNDLHHTVIQFGFKLRKLRLGIDYSIFSPENDPDIHKNFSPDSINDKIANKLFVQNYLYLKKNENIPLVILYTKSTNEILYRYMREFNRCDIQLIIISDTIRNAEIPTITEKCICIQDKSAETLKNVFSAGDFCIFDTMNSECGNPSFIAASYGCIPIIPSHRFFDFGFSYFNKITLDGNGYTYDPNISQDLMYTLWDALGVYRHDKKTYARLQGNTMKKVFSAADSVEIIEKEAEKTAYSFI